MSSAIFFRLLDEEDKGLALEQAEADLRQGLVGGSVFVANSASIRHVPGSPLAYWVTEAVRHLFSALPPFECEGRTAKQGLATADDFRFVRAWWEVDSERTVGSTADMTPGDFRQQTFEGRRWVPFAKGGEFSRYYADLHLVVDWQRDGNGVKSWICERYDYLKGKWQWVAKNPEFYFRSGITWSLRTQAGLSLRCMPTGAIFAHKGPAAFAERGLFPLLGLANSGIFRQLVSLQMAFGSYEVGVIQRTPVPDLFNRNAEFLGDLAKTCVEIKRELDTANEVSHIFSLPALMQADGHDLAGRLALWSRRVAEAEDRLSENQQKIDELALRLYGLAQEKTLENAEQLEETDGPGTEEGNEELSSPGDTPDLIARALSYAVGCAFDRWDLRIAMGARSVPDLPDPFAPLPMYSPGMLPPGTPPDGYPITVGPHGILVDDPDHPDDIVRGVRDVLAVLFKERVEGIETEACEVLGTKDFRSYFSSPRQFFNRHIQQYSKSRRKAPIYWLLQSPKGSYSLWLYYHRLNKDTLFKALTLYVEPKIRLEEGRLEALQVQRAGAAPGGKEVRQAEKAMERQEIILADLHDFHDRLRRAADLNLVPDLDDGVVLNMVPLWELIPWKEPKMYWEQLLQGKYEWSSIGQQLREKGLVRS